MASNEEFKVMQEMGGTDEPISPRLNMPPSPRASPRVNIRPVSSSSEAGTPKTPRNDDTQFFGSNFSLEALVEVASSQRLGVIEASEDGMSTRTPMTPSSPGGSSSLRRILDQPRQLVMQRFEEHGLFPSRQETTTSNITTVIVQKGDHNTINYSNQPDVSHTGEKPMSKNIKATYWDLTNHCL